MNDLIHAILVGGGIGLCCAARHFEKLMKAEAEKRSASRQNDFDSYVKRGEAPPKFPNHSQLKPEAWRQLAARNPVSRAESNADYERRITAFSTSEQANREARLTDELEKMRQKFRNSLQGRWGNPDVVPFGYEYLLCGDGTGTQYCFSGFSCEEIPLKWRCPEDWVVEIYLEYPDLPDDEEEDWERIPYDFIIADVGYGQQIVLCPQFVAQQYKADPSSVKTENMGLLYFDGPLVCHGAPP